MTTKTKTTKATTTARNAKKATKVQTGQACDEERDRGQTRRQGIKNAQASRNAGQEDQPDRSRDHCPWQIEGRDELQGDGRGHAGRGPLVVIRRRNTRREAIRIDPARDQRQGKRRSIPQDPAGPLHAGRPQVERLPPIATTTHTRSHVAVLFRFWRLG